MKEILNSINDFIQWTKKWHICHLMFTGTITIIIISITTLLVLDIQKTTHSTKIHNYCPIFEDFNNFDWLSLGIFELFVCFVLMLFISLLIYIVIIIVKHLNSKHIHVVNKFLLHNKIYNLYYYFSFLLILFSVIFTTASFILLN